MGAGFQRFIACFIWTQNRGENQGKYAPKWRLQRRCKEHFSGERNGARLAPANSAPCSKGARTVHDVPAGEGLPGVQEASRQVRSRGATPEWPAKSRRFSRPYAVISPRLHPEQRVLTDRGKAIPAVHDVGDKLPDPRKGEGLLRRLGVEGVQQLGAHLADRRRPGRQGIWPPIPAGSFEAPARRISNTSSPSRKPMTVACAPPTCSISHWPART